MTEFYREELQLDKSGEPRIVQVKKYMAPSKEILAELYRTSRSAPDVDELSHWIRKLQSLHTLYKHAIRREAKK